MTGANAESEQNTGLPMVGVNTVPKQSSTKSVTGASTLSEQNTGLPVVGVNTVPKQSSRKSNTVSEQVTGLPILGLNTIQSMSGANTMSKQSTASKQHQCRATATSSASLEMDGEHEAANNSSLEDSRESVWVALTSIVK